MIQQVHITKIKPSHYNPRKLSDSNKEHIKTSLQKFGFVIPIVVNKNNDTIVGGHQRYQIAKELGYTEVPVHYVDLTEDEERELNIRLNKNIGRWDTTKLKEVFQEEDLTKWGFNQYEIDTIYQVQEYQDDDSTQTLLESVFQSQEVPEVDILGRQKVEIYFTPEDWEQYNQLLYTHINNGTYKTERSFVLHTLKKLNK